jgi:hypothetical protein
MAPLPLAISALTTDENWATMRNRSTTTGD